MDERLAEWVVIGTSQPLTDQGLPGETFKHQSFQQPGVSGVKLRANAMQLTDAKLSTLRSALVACSIGLMAWSLVGGAATCRSDEAPTAVDDEEQYRQYLAERQRLWERSHKLADEGKHAESLVVAEQVLAMELELYGEQHRDVAGSLNWIGRQHVALDRIPAAIAVHKQRVAILEELPEVTDWKVADARRVLEGLRFERDLPAKLRAELRQAEKLTDDGMASFEEGLFQASLAEFREAYDIRKRVLGEETAATAESENNLGYLLVFMGDYAAARPLYERALAARLKILGEYHPATALSMNHLGELLVATNECSSAKLHFERSLVVNRNVLGEDHPDTVLSLHNLGTVLYDMGDYAAAQMYYEQVVAARRKAFGEEHRTTAAALNDLAAVLAHQGDYAGSRRCCERALAIHQKVLGEEHPDTARSLMNAGILHAVVGDFANSQTFVERALAMNRKLLGDDHPYTALSLSSVGHTLQSKGAFAAARPYFVQALEIDRRIFGDEHAETARSLGDLGRILAAVGDNEGAARNFFEADAIEQRVLSRELFTLSDDKLGLFLFQFSDRLDLIASLPLDSFERQRQAAEVLLGRKAIAFEVLLRRHAAEQHVEADPVAADLKFKLFIARRTLEEFALRSAANGTPEEIAERREELRKQYNECEEKFTRIVGKSLADDSQLRVSVDEVRSRLSAGCALVEFFKFSQRDFRAIGQAPRWNAYRYAACTINGDSKSNVQVIDLGSAAEIDALVSELSAQVREYQRGAGLIADEASSEQSYREVAEKLYAKLLAPLGESLGGAKQLYLGPDSRLHEIPFEALVDASGNYLVEAGYQFAYVNSGRDLVRKRPEAAGSGVYVFAGPNYDLDAAARLAATERLHGERTTLPVEAASPPLATAATISRSADTRLGWRHLPGADLEGQEAGAAFVDANWGEVQTYTGDEAVEDVLKTVRQPKALVLVTHGDFLEDEPALPTGGDRSRSFDELSFERGFSDSRGGAGLARAGLRATEDPMLRSYLLLAGANKIDELHPSGAMLDNGWLTALEISQLDLKGTDLVVLSACNTGRGRAENGQAVAGMRSAFLFAGARTIVGSLYEVPNAETRQLLKPFYEGVAANRGKLASLNAAKLDFIARRRQETGAAHPFYWASFVLVGER